MSCRGFSREREWNMEAQLWNMLTELGITDSWKPYCDEVEDRKELGDD